MNHTTSQVVVAEADFALPTELLQLRTINRRFGVDLDCGSSPRLVNAPGEKSFRIGEASLEALSVYYLGDFDPSVCDITRAVDEGIREFAPGAKIRFERVAVTSEQISVWSLPTRPTKTTDSRSKGFAGDRVEVNAIPPDTLRTFVRNCIKNHIDQGQLEQTRLVEEQEKRTLGDVVAALAVAMRERRTVEFFKLRCSAERVQLPANAIKHSWGCPQCQERFEIQSWVGA